MAAAYTVSRAAAGALRAWCRPVTNGLLVGITGYVSTVPLVIAALVAAGAQPQEVIAALTVLGLCMGLPAMVLSSRYRSPLSVGWSTGAAALLVAHGPVQGGLRSAAGAFLLAGLLTVLAGLCRPLVRALRTVPTGVCSAMLAGVLVQPCLGPLWALIGRPEPGLPIALAWIAVRCVSRPWAVPAALAVALWVAPSAGLLAITPWAPPLPSVLQPRLDLHGAASLALPLFVVTMLSQNAPALGLLRTHGYRARPRPVLLCTGGASMAGAFFGCLGVGLATVTAAMCAGPDSGPHRGRRWAAAGVAGLCQVVLGLAAGLIAPRLLALPGEVVGTVAALALLSTFLAAIRTAARAAWAGWGASLATTSTFLVACCGAAWLGAGSTACAVLAGLACHHVQRRLRRRGCRAGLTGEGG